MYHSKHSHHKHIKSPLSSSTTIPSVVMRLQSDYRVAYCALCGVPIYGDDHDDAEYGLPPASEQVP